MRKLLRSAAVLMLFLVPLPCACAKSDGGFGIYIADSGEMVLSLADVKTYHSLDYSFELNDSGIQRWNSYFNHTAEPKTSKPLYLQDFIIKIQGNELCRGKFYSLVSSMSYDGIIIRDAAVKLDQEHTTIKLDFGYPAPSFASADVLADKGRITAALERFFYARYMLTADAGFPLSRYSPPQTLSVRPIPGCDLI